MKRASMIGLAFGRWSVVGDAADDKHGNRVLFCRCACGTTKSIAIGSLTSGRSSSCGCLNAELASTRRRSHGQSKTATYNTWVSMKARCEDPSNPAFLRYGGRGIKVCDRWQSFTNFLSDMGERPSGMTIDRKDNDSCYEPGNCRWATDEQQANNRRSNRTFVVHGQSMNLTQMSRQFGIPYARLRARILRLGWPPERAVSEHQPMTIQPVKQAA